jgi:hypothetical protein
MLDFGIGALIGYLIGGLVMRSQLKKGPDLLWERWYRVDGKWRGSSDESQD